MRWHYLLVLLAACNVEEKQDCGCAGSRAVWHPRGTTGEDIDIEVREAKYAPAPNAIVVWHSAGVELYRDLDYVAFIELPDFSKVTPGIIPLADLGLDAFYCDEGSLVREGPEFYCRVENELRPPEVERLDGTLELKGLSNYELTVARDVHERIDLYLKRVYDRKLPTGEYVYECGVH